MPKYAQMGILLSFKMLIIVFFVIIFFYYLRISSLFKKKNYHKLKTVITFHFFYLENCHFRTFESQKMQKVSPPGILSLQFCQNYFFLRASILRKKVINLIKVSETDFRLRLVETKNHATKSIFLVKSRKVPGGEAIIVFVFS